MKKIKKNSQKNLEISKKSTIFAQNFCHFRQLKQPNRDLGK